MSITETPPSQQEQVEPARRRGLGGFFRTLEIDGRLLGMLGALVVIWTVFHVFSGGTFLTPRNLWNLSVQTAVVAIMATGMVLVMVTRNIDLSVGSLVGFIGMAMALLQAEIIPDYLGFGHPLTWVIVLAVGVLMGAVIGALHGALVAYVGIPSFIVTLGGLLVWRGAAWALASGRTIAPMDSTFQLLGGGSRGTLGGSTSWVVGVVACLGIAFLLYTGRRQRHKFGFNLRPWWAEITIGALGSLVVLLSIGFLNRYYMPINVARAYAESKGIPFPEDGSLQIPLGLANPVLIALAVALVMTVIAGRRRFGRYVFAIGGNPEAAELGGINTRFTVLRAFMTMGILVGIAAAVSIARLNAATSGLGTLSELYVIAAAVIGGTSLTGGIGTIPGAVLGALVMQSLQSGMVLLGVDAPLQDIVVGVVLVAAVAVDVYYRRRAER